MKEHVTTMSNMFLFLCYRLLICLKRFIVCSGGRMMKDKIYSKLQDFSKAMFIPVLILPIAGILIAVGNVLTNQRLLDIIPFLDNPITKGFGTLLSGSLVSILTNLGLIFSVGIAIGLAKKKQAEAGFTALLTFLVFINAMNKFMSLSGVLFEGESLRGTGQTLVMGVQILDMGVFLGIILGLVVAYIHNRFSDVEFNNAFQIYGGTRFVFIVLIPVTVILAVVFTYIWPVFQAGINGLGTFINQSGNFGIFTYGSLERLLIPTGLHHLVYTPFLYSPLGGTAEIGGIIFEGSRNIYFAEMADPSILQLSKSVIWDARGISKMFGLVGACLAMYQTAKPENKTKVKAILIPAVITSIIAGVTEPIEFSFMFVSPVLFLIHSGLSGLSMVVLNVLNVRAIGPNGLIDFLLYNIPLGIEKTGWPMYILVGLLFFLIYYVIFKVIITKFNIKTIGREDENIKLYSKKEYEKSVEDSKSGISGTLVLDLLGGTDNIESITHCYTRLRLEVKDPDIIIESDLVEMTKANGVLKKGNNVQVVYGLNVSKVYEAVKKEMK